MAEVGFDGADGNVAQPLKHARRAANLAGIADRGAGGVAFEEGNVGGIEAGLAIRAAQGLLLPFLGRRQEPGGAAVIGDADPADHAQHAVSGGFRIGQALQDDESGAFRRKQSVGGGMERAAPAGAADGFQGAEADVQKQIVRAVHGAGQHQVGAAVVEGVAGQADRVQRRGAGGIQGEGAQIQPQRLRQKMGGQTGLKTVLRRGRGRGAAAPHLLGVPRHAVGGQPEQTEDGAGARRNAVRPVDAAFAQRRTGGVEEPPQGFVVARDFGGGKSEAGGVEDAVETGDIAAAVGPGLLGALAQHAVFGNPPAAVRTRRDRIAVGGHQFPQSGRIESPRKDAAAPDNGDRLEAHSPGTAYISTSLMLATRSPPEERNSTSQTILLPPAVRPATRQVTGPLPA